ncbi:hypothetical protein GCM10009759_49050 [Kitasatospora saccharophila]|uniref:Uncharacterized protein n=1 Tax=Kitasatospora saccharophila TaxID=407973 RepID=A0ABN2XDR8_9ACTN
MQAGGVGPALVEGGEQGLPGDGVQRGGGGGVEVGHRATVDDAGGAPYGVIPPGSEWEPTARHPRVAVRSPVRPWEARMSAMTCDSVRPEGVVHPSGADRVAGRRVTGGCP